MRLRLPQRVGPFREELKNYTLDDAIRIVDALILFSTGRKWNRADRRRYVLNFPKYPKLVLHAGRVSFSEYLR